MATRRPAAATFELCEYASVNGDGTHTILRGGIERWTAVTPFDLQLYGFLELPDGTSPGTHALQVKVVNPNNEESILGLGLVEVASTGRAIFVIPLQLRINQAGIWEFRVVVGDAALSAKLETIARVS